MTSSVDLQPGTIVARCYQIIAPLGRGGMGELYVARNTRTERRVALKLLRPDTKQNPDAIERFRREARAAGLIKSDHVTQVLDVDDDPEQGIVIAFELLEGESLLARLRRAGPMDVVSLHPIVTQMFRGLGDAHAVDIVHRDLKPANVFLERLPDGSTRVKLLDFGISKLPKLVAKTTLTEPGTSLGSFMFMPPEQIQLANAVDQRADIYAVGTLVYQSLTGQLPFESSDLTQLVRKKLTTEPRTLSESLGHPVPASLEAWMSRSLKRAPQDRFQTAAEAGAAWEALWRDLVEDFDDESMATIQGGPPPMSGRMRSRMPPPPAVPSGALSPRGGVRMTDEAPPSDPTRVEPGPLLPSTHDAARDERAPRPNTLPFTMPPRTHAAPGPGPANVAMAAPNASMPGANAGSYPPAGGRTPSAAPPPYSGTPAPGPAGRDQPVTRFEPLVAPRAPQPAYHPGAPKAVTGYPHPVQPPGVAGAPSGAPQTPGSWPPSSSPGQQPSGHAHPYGAGLGIPMPMPPGAPGMPHSMQSMRPMPNAVGFGPNDLGKRPGGPVIPGSVSATAVAPAKRVFYILVGIGAVGLVIAIIILLLR